MDKNLKIDWKLVKKISDLHCNYQKRPKFSLKELKEMLQNLYDYMTNGNSCNNVSRWIFLIERKESANKEIPVCIVSINYEIDYWFEEKEINV